jgi:hypothetical protein
MFITRSYVSVRRRRNVTETKTSIPTPLLA